MDKKHKVVPTKNPQDKFFIHVIILSLRFTFWIVQRGLVAAFVFSLSVPIFIIIFLLADFGLERAADFLFTILLFPAFIQGKETLELFDLVIVFGVWSLIFGVFAAIIRFISRNRIRLPKADKVLHRAYVAVYLIALVITPFLPLAHGSSSRVSVAITFIVFFLIGYVAFWTSFAFRKLLELLDSMGS